MNSSLFYLIYIALLFTTSYGLTKNEVLNGSDHSPFYCKDDICVEDSYENRIDLGTIIIPNSQGKNITYITDTCSMNDIDLNLCFSKECTVDTECLSNKCVKGHCAFNEANPIVHCQYVRTVHDDPLFGDPHGFKMQCGLPKGDKCNSNDDCSSYNCVKYSKNSLCEEPDDSGCTSLCGNNIMGTFLLFFVVIPVVFIIIFISICCSCMKKGKKLDEKRENKNNISVV